MLRGQRNGKAIFSVKRRVLAQNHGAAMHDIGAEMDAAWEALDDEWLDFNQRSLAAGIVEHRTYDEDLVWINVSGSCVNVPHSAIKGLGASSMSWKFGNLFEVAWDKRLPRDAEDCILLDQSPACFKNLLHTCLKDHAAASSSEAPGGILAIDEIPHLAYVAGALGIVSQGKASPPKAPSPKGSLVVTGDSAILTPVEVGHLLVTMATSRWFPGGLNTLDLIYRATRDGVGSGAFLSRCGDVGPGTFILIKVRETIDTNLISKKCLRYNTYDSVIGGFSDVPWAAGTEPTHFLPSVDAFVFTLTDGRSSSGPVWAPVRYALKPGYSDHAIVHKMGMVGLSFGVGDMTVAFSEGPSKPTLVTGNKCYSAPDGSAFMRLGSRTSVEDIEVFRVDTRATVPLPIFSATLGADSVNGTHEPGALVKEHADYVRRLCNPITDALMEERVALRNARGELAHAKARAAAAIEALTAVYGPDIASGKNDEVVELSVRGTRMTTLLSTLQVCPDSALAARFNEERWPTNGKNVVESGWRVIDDCSPAVFSKVLDVLRIRKRAGWAPVKEEGENGGGERLVRVVVRDQDRSCFDEFVGMYFPGCESFITDLVQPSTAPGPDNGSS